MVEQQLQWSEHPQWVVNQRPFLGCVTPETLKQVVALSVLTFNLVSLNNMNGRLHMFILNRRVKLGLSPNL